MNKLGIWGIAIAGAFFVGILSANPVVEAVGGWKAAIAGHEARIAVIEDVLDPIETIQVDGLLVQLTQNFPNNIGTSIAECPTSHPFLIGGSHTFRSIDSSPGAHIIIPLFDTDTNTYEVEGSVSSGNGIEFQAHALCAKLL